MRSKNFFDNRLVEGLEDDGLIKRQNKRESGDYEKFHRGIDAVGIEHAGIISRGGPSGGHPFIARDVAIHALDGAGSWNI